MSNGSCGTLGFPVPGTGYCLVTSGGSLLGGGTSNKGLGSKCLTGMGLTGCLTTCGKLVSFTNCLWGDPLCITGFWSGRLTSPWSTIFDLVIGVVFLVHLLGVWAYSVILCFCQLAFSLPFG